jgi:serine/threonine protein kinase
VPIWTRTGSYMAPERFRDGEVRPSSDIYALGCVLYQCLTGQLPFPRTTMEQVAMAHMLDPSPKPSTQQPGVRNGFDDRPAARRLTLFLVETRCLGMPPDLAAVNHQQRRTH